VEALSTSNAFIMHCTH